MLEHELGRLKNGLLMMLARQLFQSMMKRSNLVLAVSNVLSRKFGGNMKVLPNGVDMRKMDYATRHPLNLKLHRPIVGFIGSFEYFIDFDLMIDVASRMPHITFLMVGGGRLWEQVRGSINKKNLRNVTLTGTVRHEDVFRYIGEMDICLNIFKKIPVSHGACPIKLFEYLSMKKPVITTRLDEILIIDKGFLEYGDTVEEVISSINKLLLDQDLRSMMSEKGFQEVLREYTWPRISQRLLETFETM
jgi:glycosyltransferase involved in cell wall biosynthesis